MYIYSNTLPDGYGLLQAAPFHRSDEAVCQNSRVLLGLRRTQGGQLLREDHQARLPEGESEGALARKDQRPGGESRRQGRLPDEDVRRIALSACSNFYRKSFEGVMPFSPYFFAIDVG